MPQLTPEEIAYQQAHADDDNRPNRIAACTCGIAIAVSAVAARIIIRRRSGVKLWWDDCTIVIALGRERSYRPRHLSPYPSNQSWTGGLSTKRKIQLLVGFLLGTVLCVSGLVRTVAIFSLNTRDISYDGNMTLHRDVRV
ncbi:uncharacterized protein BDV17DRAFT_295977 [Aspergillus undulatus]|uniref:uncharacterized protein n=1 Tax=Aspergillus undulatus TaxID=1810928 RepID=UPI003CCDB272